MHLCSSMGLYKLRRLIEDIFGDHASLAKLPSLVLSFKTIQRKSLAIFICLLQESCREVQAVISYLKPEVLPFLKLSITWLIGTAVIKLATCFYLFI